MSWATQRQFKYLGIIFGFFLIILFLIFYPVIFKKPTCNDGKQNGNETGVDCGGVCSSICLSNAKEPVVIWSRAFPLTGNNYNLAAYVLNKNQNAGIERISYEFRVYDTNNKLIGRREGFTYLPPNQPIVIFEPRFNSFESEVKSVFFDFTSSFSWVKKEPTISKLPIFVKDIFFENGVQPTLVALIKNETTGTLVDFDAIGILYDSDDNVINVSKTSQSLVKSNETKKISFTWPEKLVDVSVRQEVLLQINPFNKSFEE